MKSKQIRELRKMSESELLKEMESCQEALFKYRFQKVVEEFTDTTVIGKTKRKIAQIKTILHQRKLETETNRA